MKYDLEFPDKFCCAEGKLASDDWKITGSNLTGVDNEKVGVDNEKALELTNSTVFHRGRQ